MSPATEVHSASNWLEVEQAFIEFEPDIGLLDLHMLEPGQT